jgi:hypothetical protein
MATYAEGSQDIMKIVIGVPTYRRPKMLQQALTSIAKLNIPADYLGAPVEVTVVIVDNDPERSARETVAQFSTCSSESLCFRHGFLLVSASTGASVYVGH